jgi:nucleotide-binding universal stress UspA family protein
MFSHVVVGWDGSGASDRAVDVAAEVVLRFGARLEIVEVVSPVPHRGPDEAARAEERRAQIDHARGPIERCEQHGIAATLRLVEGTDAARVLVDEVHRSGADLLVLGHRTAGTLERRVTGDVAERVLRIATTPILIVGDEGRT